MGYWIEGRLEGKVLLDFAVEFSLKGWLSPYHSEEHLFEILEGDVCEVDPDLPYDWVTEAGCVVKKVRLLREDPNPNDDYECEADYEVVIEFLEVSVPFCLEGWSEKLTCAEDNLGYSINMRKILADLSRESPRSVKGLRVTDARIEAEFTGEGEDGEKVDMKLSGSVPCGERGWGG